jgi:hypothetical protein
MGSGVILKKLVLSVALAMGLGFSQAPVSKLKGKTIYLHRQFVDGGHANGFIALKTLLQTNAATYGYTLEISENPLTADQINTVFGRLYKGDGTRPANGIDVLIFSQGEGDWNISGNPVLAGSDTRMKQVNAHVRGGGGLIITHAAAGREISRSGWIFGAKLMTDWFQDEYYASPAVSGNGGHFGSGTAGTATFDEETLPSKDSSAYFVRNLMLLEKAKGGYAMPIQTDQVRGEWYHFNGGYKYEGQQGGKVSNPNNKFQPAEVRGNAGYPDSGIGPNKVFTVLTKIQGANYTPPGKGRVSVWGREVGKGVFDKTKSSENGRFVYFNPGHAGDEYTLANGWMGNLYLSMLRWVVKDDRGCTDSRGTNYNALATVNDGTCTGITSIAGSALENAEWNLGRISAQPAGLTVSISEPGMHSLEVVDMNGSVRFRRAGSNAHEYVVPNLQHGLYMVRVAANGKSVTKRIMLF